MQLKTTGRSILNQISELANQLSDAEYGAELDLLSGNSIGKHVRHIVEFFELLVSGAEKGLINYDKRSHAPIYETDTSKTLAKIKELSQRLDAFPNGKEVILEVSYTDSDSDAVRIKSSIERELAYNIEHAIHHMAIIKIAVQTVFPNVKLAQNFGVAYSTVRYQKSVGH